MTPLRWVGVGLALVLLALCGFVLWTLNTPSGAVLVANVATRVLQGKLSIGDVRGTISGPLLVTGVRYRDLPAGVDLSIESASIDVALRELIWRRVHVLDGKVSGVTFRRTEPTKPPEPEKPFSFQPPIDMVVDRFTVQGASVSKDGKPLFEARRAVLIGRWTNAGIGIRQLDVESPQGKINIVGTVDKENAYVGQASGNFVWTLGQLEYAGAIKLDSNPREAKLDAQLRAPTRVHLIASLQQQESLPWNLELRVPMFDPRKKLAPDTSIESLALSLRGQGDRTRAEVRGDVIVDSAHVFIDPLRVTLADQAVDIQELTLRDANHRGVLNVAGNVRFDQKPFFADVTARWSEVEIPPQLAGQKLATHGEIKVRGNPDAFNAAGNLAIGPPDRLADIVIAASGTPQEILLEKLSVVQKEGSLTATGRIGLKPSIDWRITAEAQRFDPGALVAGWPGQLGFKLASEGKLEQAGPSATLKLDELAGTLRQRVIGGEADLTLTPSKAVTGTLSLRSGASAIRVSGAGGETLDLTAELNVASVSDWLPEGHGQVRGDIRVKGRWPQIQITGDVNGQGLALNQLGAQTVHLSLDITEPLHPRGSVNMTAQGVAAAGFEFSTLALRASGSESDHTASLKADGKPIATEIRVHGQRLENGWSGTVDTLTLNVPDIEQLTLRQPTQVTFTGPVFSISESCLANSQLSACAAAQGNAEKEMQAHYVFEHLPLALLAAFGKPDLPVSVKGVLEGKGDVRRAADGSLFGNATITSSSGSVADVNNASDPLLSYENLQLTADLNGNTARASAQMSFNNDGKLQGEASFGDLNAAAPTIQGHGTVSVGDLSLIGLFVTQLANVKGRADGDATVSGTIASPNIQGTARVQGFAAELPVLGLQLKDGDLEANAAGSGNIKLTGHITSGDGKLTFDGSGDLFNVLRVTATGKNFVGANIPGANVVIDPELSFTRSQDRMDLTGKVTVSNAKVDLSKLPRTNRAKSASADVIVVDDPGPTPEQAAKAKALPLQTVVTIVLTDKVSLAGYGLDAKLGGQLEVSESPGSDPLGAGEVRLEGTYKAYGQDLTIERGRLLYANTPLSDPQVDIVAVREIEDEDVKAMLTVKGSAQSPLLEVSSDPALPQTQALSYLVTGKPMDQLGSGEGDLMQSAARSLGGAAGNLLAKNFGRRLGISDIGVENSNEIGGSAFTVGQYLSPRLYISYGVGLFEPGQVVTLRYRLSRAIAVEASQGPKSQRAGINYKVEK